MAYFKTYVYVGTTKAQAPYWKMALCFLCFNSSISVIIAAADVSVVIIRKIH